MVTTLIVTIFFQQKFFMMTEGLKNRLFLKTIFDIFLKVASQLF